jgi:hypothetical protein
MKRISILSLLGFLVGSCGSSTSVTQPAVPDLTNEAWYGESVAQLTEWNRQAASFEAEQLDEAAKLIVQGGPVRRKNPRSCYLNRTGHIEIGTIRQRDGSKYYNANRDWS